MAPASRSFARGSVAAVETRAAHRATGRGPAMFAVPQHADAVDEHIAHSDRILVRFLKGRPIADRGRVEDHDIGIIAGLERPPLLDAEVDRKSTRLNSSH